MVHLPENFHLVLYHIFLKYPTSGLINVYIHDDNLKLTFPLHFDLSIIFKAYSLFVDVSLHNLTTAKFPKKKGVASVRKILSFLIRTIPYRSSYKVSISQGIWQNDVIILAQFLQ